eukprot:NODE_5177_length_1054_cov_45.723953_g4619_i0.p1 GENE.NODE_5177_length_1054_cov_45.723953_g4619_i0~~NODE_5177_length_1054_cov_45.723953_g4619_i0.p1  ORF type:complete len:210 (-),score=31.53 NODE_5177_length_1054_cov_45.723953_g4619_i0:255-884(-)
MPATAETASGSGNRHGSRKSKKPAETMTPEAYLRRHRVDQVIGHMLDSVLHEAPAEPLVSMVAWLERQIAKEQERRRNEQSALESEGQSKHPTLKPTITQNDPKNTHLSVVQDLEAKLVRMENHVLMYKFRKIEQEATTLQTRALRYGYERMEYYLRCIMEEASRCAHLDESSNIQPMDIERLKSLVAVSTSHLMTLRMELDLLFDTSE